MRWPQESAITRRDEQLALTRRLSMWVAGGATAASLALAAALGFALPGHTATSTARPASQPGSGSRQSSGQSTGSGSAHHRRGLTPPRQAPANAGAPPVVSSGGS